MLAFLIFLLSCRGGNTQDTAQPNSANPLLDLAQRVDTIAMANAPTKITRKIRRNKDGTLLIAAFDEVLVFDGKEFRPIPKPQHLESFDAFDALQDTKGNIWIASTHFGVYQYNGNDFKHFTIENGLPSNRTIDLYEDRSGNIWIATMGGLVCFDGKKIRNYTIKDGLSSNDINTIIEDQHGNIWIGTRENACILVDDKITDITAQHGFGLKNVRCILEDRNGNIWLGGSDGLWKYDGKNFENISKNMTTHIFENRQGDLFTNSQKPNTADWTLSKYSNPQLSSALLVATELLTESNILFGINEDSEGNILIGGTRGLYRFDGKRVSYFKDQ